MKDNFKPTWLYVKQHNSTGLRYFGKTVKDPLIYKGSGKRWNHHLNKYGNDVTTLWCRLFTNKEELVAYALNFSKKNSIVESKSWANLIIEDGLTGGDNPYSYTEAARKKQSLAKKGLVKSKETCEKLRIANTGKKRSPEQNLQNSIRQKGQPGLIGEANGQFGKPAWNKGKKTGPTGKPAWNSGVKTGPRSPTTINGMQGVTPWNKGKSYSNPKISKIQFGVKRGPQKRGVCPHCGREIGMSNLKKYHLDNCKLAS